MVQKPSFCQPQKKLGVDSVLKFEVKGILEFFLHIKKYIEHQWGDFF